MGARSKINAISLNMKISKPKSVNVCGYKLPINVQNFMQKDSAQAKILSKVVGGLLFLTHPVDSFQPKPRLNINLLKHESLLKHDFC